MIHCHNVGPTWSGRQSVCARCGGRVNWPVTDLRMLSRRGQVMGAALLVHFLAFGVIDFYQAGYDAGYAMRGRAWA